MELTPRTAPEAPAGTTSTARRRRNPLAYAVLVAVALGLVVVVWQALTSASLYFYNADEAVEQRTELGDKRFRLQGTVVGDSIERTEDGVLFAVAYRGAEVDVHHQGDPPELFQAGIPVVLEGRWSATGDEFDSDTIKVKHSADYEAEHEDRLDDAESGGTTSTP